MNKLKIYYMKSLVTIFVALLVLDMSLALSDKVNQSGLPALENLTRADNVYEMTTELNRASDGIIGMFIWLGISIVGFMSSLYVLNSPISALGFGSFLGSIVSVLFYIIDLGTGFMIYVSVIALISSIVMLRLQN
jgi:hypothetical protein